MSKNSAAIELFGFPVVIVDDVMLHGRVDFIKVGPEGAICIGRIINIGVEEDKMADAPKFLLDEHPEQIEDDVLDRLSKLVDQQLDLESRITELEVHLKALNEAHTKVSRVDIPELLHTHGLSEIRLKDRRKVIVSEGVSVSVPEDKQEAFNEFLKAQKAEDLVKLQIAFGRMPDTARRALFAFIQAMDYEYDAKSAVHPSTLKKFVSDLLGLGVDEDERADGIKQGIYKRVDDLKDVMNVFTFFTTKIKEPK